MKRVLTFFIYTYKALTVSTVHRCRYYPTCSEYALCALKRLSLFKAMWKIVCRVCSCHPWSKKQIVDILIEERDYS